MVLMGRSLFINEKMSMPKSCCLYFIGNSFFYVIAHEVTCIKKALLHTVNVILTFLKCRNQKGRSNIMLTVRFHMW
ncbi:hypothetical protein COL11_14175 [Bacillus anthracis]|nr:hypothetical protein CON22_23860 [Bacillus cereus]PEU82118.1 hypothetical protein CN394_09500 [Bacillus anthracis]PEZ24686.1 hypothetical protein CN337_07605 [Bacillus anthracis]PEZ76741.1 hypothetical protein CN410_10290 [Bacillus anthracis]PFF06564.1 hypothetical protein CN315_18965 [Bacillus cereus]